MCIRDRLIVPKTVSDTLLSHSVKYRSQNRIPTLTYYYSKTGSSITRSAQPLPGITQQRSIQDEKLVNEIFKCSQNGSCSVGSHPIKNIIVDARPATNAMAQTALGGGTENTDNYNFNNTCTRMFLGIDNIHVMRDTLNSVVENFLVDNDLNLPIDKANLNKGKASNWLKYVKLLLSSTDTPVSYTHLDVYKRQHTTRFCCIPVVMVFQAHTLMLKICVRLRRSPRFNSPNSIGSSDTGTLWIGS